MQAVRTICKSFVARGLPNYPHGIIFTFWEQYVSLRFYLAMALVAALAAIFVILALTLLNVVAAFLVVLRLICPWLFVNRFFWEMVVPFWPVNNPTEATPS